MGKANKIIPQNKAFCGKYSELQNIFRTNLNNLQQGEMKMFQEEVFKITKKEFTVCAPSFNTIRKWCYNFEYIKKESRDLMVKLMVLTLDNFLTNKYQDVILAKKKLTSELEKLYGKEFESSKEKEIGKISE